MNSRRSIVPAFFLNPLCLVWAMAAPEACLLMLNLRAWLLVRGELESQWPALLIVLFLVGLIAASATVALVLRARQREVKWFVCLPLLVAHIGYLWYVTCALDELVPASVSIWILPPQTVLFHQFAFVMPGVFFCAFAIACIPLTRRLRTDVAISASTVLTVPLLWYMTIRVGHSLFGSQPFAALLIVFGVLSTCITLMAFLRLLMLLFGWSVTLRSSRVVLVFLASAAAPFGGLALNAKIPFPVDLQYPSVYVLTGINAAVLTLACLLRRKAPLTAWLSQAAVLPFSLYFFLLFLPFLPLSLPAMFVAGAGLLIWAPTLLFALHARGIVEDYPGLKERYGNATCLASFAGAALVLPALFVSDAVIDRHHLRAATAAVYAPDTSQTVSISPRRVGRSLEELRDAKAGVFLPFITGAYRALVFDGMVLPQRKVQEVYRAFLGCPMPDAEHKRAFREDFLWGRGWRAERAMRGQTAPPSRNVVVTGSTVSHSVADGMVTSELSLELTNDASRRGEYVGRIQVDPGVLVTGYWLEIEGEPSPGRIYEKRAAMWVYHMIRDVTGLDPGLLIYERPDMLKLSVFPFGSNEVRRTGIEFLFPHGLAASVTVDGQPISLGAVAEADVGAVRVQADDGSRFAVLPETTTRALPTVTRMPSWVLIVDRSAAAAGIASEQWVERIDQFAERLPEGGEFTVVAANYQAELLTPQPIDQAGAQAAFSGLATLATAGALCPIQAIQRSLAGHRSRSPESVAARVPVCIVLSAGDTLTVGDLAGVVPLFPDVGVWYELQDRQLWSVDLLTGARVSASAVAAPSPIAMVKGESWVPVSPGLAAWVRLAGDSDILTIAAPEGARESRHPVPLTGPKAEQYANGLVLWETWRETTVNPARLDQLRARLVQGSRRHRLLIPVTSFMVPENSAQLAMLERKHKQGQAADTALEFDEFQESPAPGLLLLLPLLLVGFLGRQRNRRGRVKAVG